MKQNVLLILALLLTAVSGAWAQTDTPLTLEAATAGTIVVSSPQSGMQYTRNDGAKTIVTSDAIDVAVGDKVAFYGNGTSITSYDGTNIAGGTAECYIYGNIMSLVDETGFATATELTEGRNFYNLFNGNAKIINHPTKKLELPATTLADECYNGMFCLCTSLTTAPALPATTLAQNCYFCMFQGCTSLTTAPALPATTLEGDCYDGMFQGCTSLTTAPALPATTLAQNCYRGMFRGCTSLTTAPALPATTLADGCYAFMFQGCTSLNCVICLATDISASDATDAWLNGVAGTGTLTKAKSMIGWTAGSNIPSGWTIVDNDVVLTDGDNVATALGSHTGETIGVTYTRMFTEGKASTVCLPFAYTKKAGDGSFYAFSGIEKDGDEFVATMTDPGTSTLTTNTPYLYMPSATGSVNFSGTYAIPADITAGSTTSGAWTFAGTYSTIEWTTEPVGIYGFSAQDANDGITQGQFVKVGEYVRIRPMRAYLKYKGGAEDYAEARLRRVAGKDEELPESIRVRLVSASGEVTAIGSISTKTGEVTLDDAWYTLDGVRLDGRPTRKGIYILNGKKIAIQ